MGLLEKKQEVLRQEEGIDGFVGALGEGDDGEMAGRINEKYEGDNDGESEGGEDDYE